MPDATPRGTRSELIENRAGYVALIDQLDREGLIDRRRIGIHGFSRTGFYVQDALTFSDIEFAAASVTDASGLSAASYGSFFGFRYPGMLEYERLLGVPLWADENARTWAERDPSFHADRVGTPLRIEAYNQMIGPWWETYTNLHRHQRPADFLYFPQGAHQLAKPRERLTSQGGTVDR